MALRVALATVAAAAVAVATAAVSGGAPRDAASAAFAGSYTVSPPPGTTATSPWTNGGTLTIRRSSESEVESLGFRNTSSEQACFHRELYPNDPDPAVSAWYVATWSWKGGGSAGGCVSRNTRGKLVAAAGNVTLDFYRDARGGFGGCWGDVGGCMGFVAQLGTGSKPPSGGKPAAGRTRTVATPAPGRSVEVTSPQDLPACPEGFRVPSSARATCSSVDVNVTAEPSDLKKTTIVGEGEIYGDPKKVGEAVATCWLIGPDTIPLLSARVTQLLKKPEYKAEYDSWSAQEQLDACLYLVTLAAQDAARTTSSVDAGSAACRARQIGVTVRVKGGKLYPVAAAQKTVGRTRYTCTTTATGLTLKVTTSTKGGLRGTLGKKLDLGVVRTPKAPKASGKLAFNFAW